MEAPTRPIRRSYRPTLTGALYVLTSLLLAIGAINGQNNLLFWAFGLAVSGLLVSGVLSGASLMGVRATRRATSRAVVGGDVELHYEVFNHNRLLPCVGVNLTEHPAAGGSPGAGEVARARDFFATVVSIGARRSAVVRARVPALARGRLELDAFEAWSLFPFGVMRKSVRFSTAARVLVRPRPLVIPGDAFDAVLREGLGMVSARHAVAGVRGGEEYFSLREYSQGDASRDIAWKRSAVGESPLVKVYMPRRTSRVWVSVVLPAATPEESERVVSAAAGLVELAAERRIEVGLWAPGCRGDGRDVMLRPAGGPAAYALLLDTLAELVIPASATRHAPPAAPGDRVVEVHAGGQGASGLDARSFRFAGGGA
ncbi:MAG: DUF58 domain-containing protein [Phycisphaerae bacterium]|nr:DUF58 domain-containing protein [Phycisphaerae bacterium]